MYLTLELDREEDGRYIAEVPDLPGVLAYGSTEGEATARAGARPAGAGGSDRARRAGAEPTAARFPGGLVSVAA
jgi:hypothetical protein